MQSCQQSLDMFEVTKKEVYIQVCPWAAHLPGERNNRIHPSERLPLREKAKTRIYSQYKKSFGLYFILHCCSYIVITQVLSTTN